MSEDEGPPVIYVDGVRQDGKKSSTSSSSNEEHQKEADMLLREIGNGSEGHGVYSWTPAQLSALVDPKNPYILRSMGGVQGLSKALNTNSETGLINQQLVPAEVAQREKVYGRNTLPERKAQSLLQIIWQTLNDKVLIILIIAAVISLALGLYETFGEPVEHDPEGRPLPKVDWVEGVAILVAVVVVTMVGSLNDWQKERQFVKLNRKKDDRMIEVIRNKSEEKIKVEDVMVGDILAVQPGDILPVDGVLMKSYDIQCDESSATGESDTLRKYEAAAIMKRLDHATEPLDPSNHKLDCFMLSGAKVLEGTGYYMATSIGEHSMHGRTMLSLHHENEVTPLQEKLNRIADGIAKFGVISALILFIVLFIRFLVQISGDNRFSDLTPSQKGTKFMDIFIVAVTIVVVAVPEGLPLAVTLALAFATTRMIKDNCLVRVLRSCETMGGATTICSDKTGTLTENVMTVVAATVGNEEWDEGENASDVVSKVDKKLLADSICINSTAYEDRENPQEIQGSKTESALLLFAREHLGVKQGTLSSYRESAEPIKLLPFDSSRKYMFTVIPMENGGGRLLIKGAAEILLSQCSTVWGPSSNEPMEKHRDFHASQIDKYGSEALRAIAIAYKDFDAKQVSEMENITAADIDVTNLTYLGLFGIKDPLRKGVREAVGQCQRAGVVVRMVTGDNVRTARAIAINAGIISEDDKDSIVMEGPQFRKLSEHDMASIVPRLRVLARSSPHDKRTLVAYLKEQGETVAVTGDGTNDAPALKLADVGFSMGITGTEVAKEASDIIIMDDNFASIVNAIKWGRTVNDAVKKFLQFQLTVNVTAVALTFITAVASSDNESVLTAVQLLWVNLIMDTLAALALATDAPVDSVLDRAPDNRKKSLITPTMWKIIFGQAFFQLAVTLTLHFASPYIWGIAGHPHDSRKDTQLSAMIFNTFVWMQFFQLFISRRLDNKQNFLEGIGQNYYFIVVVCIIGGFQVLIMFVGGAAFSIRRQTGAMWAVALICGFCSIPWGMVLRQIPDELVMKLYPRRFVRFLLITLDEIGRGISWLFSPVVKLFAIVGRSIKWLFCKLFRVSKRDESTGDNSQADSRDSWSGSEQNYEWIPGIQKSLDELAFLKYVHGGRVARLNSNANEATVSRRRRIRRRNLYIPTRSSRSSSDCSGSSLAALMAPVVVSGAIGGWHPEART
ncbi:Calcium-transporting ATPase 2 [Wickerhamiella sorbophila]|uniref:Calcium-transporting ATPase n=1 Tax=Wickerhamiella sorbophila TaxID=45607 RepID=A0A2T0FJ64_9ASCO|nr:Calcium-transporting ATPase 2 [Wickerhamiella sorbophila]PRT54979.1 Calcium-transporting ATPase 2 [Wickerhamiella sorbophila]